MLEHHLIWLESGDYWSCLTDDDIIATYLCARADDAISVKLVISAMLPA